MAFCQGGWQARRMRFSQPLSEGVLERRYKRFLCDVTLADGTAVTAHCANPGAMLGLTAPGSRVWLSHHPGKGRKLEWSWELIEADDTLVGINTGHPNTLVREAIEAGAITELTGYDSLRREVKYGANSRVDLLLESPDKPPCYVEVKNVHLSREAGLAEFPDSVTARGRKHLEELAAMVAGGARAVMVYLVQRSDCARLRLAADIDPAYVAAYVEARRQGVEALCYTCRLSPEGIDVAGAVPVETPA